MIKDISNDLGPVVAFGPIALDADNVPVAVDLDGYRAAMILIAVGVGGITFDGSNKIEFTVQDSDNDSTYADVTQADIEDDITVATGGIVKSLTAAHAAATVTKVGYIGGKRYLKIKADFTGTHGGTTPICVLVVKGKPLSAPAS
jgi:hypothetical protein